jgi:sugar lactone lactonase YvrE
MMAVLRRNPDAYPVHPNASNIRRVLVRRALVVCLGAVLVVVVFAYARQQAPAIPQAIGHAQPTVVVQDVAARALAIAHGSAVFLSLATSQNRLFELPLSASTTNAAPALAPVAGTGFAGSLGDGGAALSAQLDLMSDSLYARSGIALGADGSMYIADTQNATIRRVAGPNSTEPGVIRSIVGRWAPKQNVTLLQPSGIALDRGGNLYIADRGAGSLDVLSAETGTLESLAQVADAAGVAVAADGTRAFVTSPSNGSVVGVNLHTRSLQIEAIPGSRTAVPSDAQNSSPCVSSPPVGDSARFCPAGVAVDAAGNLFVSDLWNGRVWRVDTHTGSRAIVLTGLQKPGALAFDPEGQNLYVAEQGQDRIIVADGMGSSGNLSLAPASASFANEPTGGVSQQQQFVLTNNSLNSVSGIATSFQSTASSAQTDFTQQSSSCVSTLLAGANCTINVAFTPTSVGTLSYSMNVTDSATDSASATLTGTGDDYQIQLPSGQLQELSVIQGQAVTFHLQVAALGAFGQNGEQVSFVCPNNVPAETTCTFKPTSVSPAAGSSVPFAITFQTSSNNTHSQLHIPGPLWPRGIDGKMLVLLACAFLGISTVLLRRRFQGALAIGTALAALIVFVGCHHPTVTSAATPPGTVTMTVQGVALDENGNPLNATRGYSIILDVIAK